MKAFLLAAGKGTRLKPYTQNHPKCLIPIHGEPLLKIWLSLLQHYGIDAVLINTHHHAGQVERFVEKQQADFHMTIKTVYEPELLGSAGTIWRNRSFVAGDSDFMVAYADNLTNLNLGKMIDFHKKIRSMGGILTMGLIRAEDPTACGIVNLDDRQKIVTFVEKPDQPKSDLANGGVFIAAAEFIDELAAMALKEKYVADLGYDVLPYLAGKMFGYRIPEYLADIGTPQRYDCALRHWKKIAMQAGTR